MSTSGVYAETTSTQQIVRQAMLNIGSLDANEDPGPREYDDCRRLLNMLVSQWMAKADFSQGIKVWTRKRGFCFLSSSGHQYDLSSFNVSGWTNSFTKVQLSSSVVAGASALALTSQPGIAGGNFIGVVCSDGSLFWSTVSSVTTTVNLTSPLVVSADSRANVFYYSAAAQYPVVVETALLRDDNSTDTPLRIMVVQSYDMLSNKTDPTNTGDPTAIYVEEKLGYTSVYTDVAVSQDVNKYLVLTYLEPVQKFINPTDEPCYPEEWYRPLHWALAKEIAPMFKKKWTEVMESNYQLSSAIARNKTSEKSALYFQCGEDE